MHQLPEPLLQSLSQHGDFNTQAFIDAHTSETKLTSIRLNPFKKATLDFKTGDPVKWNKQGLYLNERPYFTHDPLFHAGAYYVQEAGSMFLEQALTQTLDFTQSLKVLDLCAAPGGKSTLINSLLNADSLLVANETVKSRADVLAQNLGRWGTANCVVTNSNPERFSGINTFFDALVIDAPCSGSGLFRKQADAIEHWSPEAVASCSIRQKSILSDCLPALKQNGILVYSTCSYSFEENEDIVQWLINEHDMEYVPLNIQADWGIVETAFGYRFYPHLTQSEGFFCAVLKKVSQENQYTKKTEAASNINKDELALLAPFLNPSANLLHKINGRLHFLNHAALQFLTKFEKHFYYKKAGTLLGEIKGGKLVPEQELAWSIYVSENTTKLDLDLEAAIKYLKKENFLSGIHAQNLVLLSYKNYGLGWAKILQNRVNNYLPNELRILK